MVNLFIPNQFLMGHIKTFLRGGLHIAMVTIFSLFAEKSILKYVKEDKGVYITFSEIEKVQYPSVTICKRQAFNEKLNDLVHDDDTPIEVIEAAILENVTKKKDIFYFVSHPNMTKSEHPCLTTKNSVDPGKPCIFPFKSGSGLRFSCSRKYFDLGWYGTKPPSDASGSVDWGYCSKYCKSENLI